MQPRIVVVVWGLVAFAGALAGPAAAQPLSPRGHPAVLIVLKPGGSKEALLIWDEGAGGRVPVFLMTGKAELSKEDRDRLEDVPEYRSGGVVAKYDRERSDTVRAQTRPTGKTLVAAVRVTADADAKPGTVKVYLHHVAGTGRSMYLRSEIRVVIARE